MYSSDQSCRCRHTNQVLYTYNIKPTRTCISAHRHTTLSTRRMISTMCSPSCPTFTAHYVRRLSKCMQLVTITYTNWQELSPTTYKCCKLHKIFELLLEVTRRRHILWLRQCMAKTHSPTNYFKQKFCFFPKFFSTREFSISAPRGSNCSIC